MSADDLSDLIESWPGTPSLIVATEDQVLGSAGDVSAPRPIASITKLFTTWAILIAVEEGTVALDQPAGPAGSTLRHLLAHASGVAFDDDTLHHAPGQRRVYSNTGIEMAADLVAHHASMPFADYLRLGVFEPLGLNHLVLRRSPAHGLVASCDDLVRFAREVLNPTLLAPSTVQEATSPVWPDLRGVLPGFGGHDPNPWGLGFEIRGAKQPHWTGPTQAASTFGHFGGAGSFLWIDPDERLVAASVGTEAFAPWAADAWPRVNETIYHRYRTT